MFANLPPFATFVHSEARDGFEVVHFRDQDGSSPSADGFLLEGGTTATEDGIAWSVQYRIAVDRAWRTTLVDASGITPSGHHHLRAEAAAAVGGSTASSAPISTAASTSTSRRRW